MTHTVHLQFEEIDNTVLQRLCGALDSNLETLGKALDIQISRRFEHFTFMGELAHAGRHALLSLAEAAEKGDLDDNAISLAAVEAKTADEKHEEKHQRPTNTISAPNAAASAAVPAPKRLYPRLAQPRCRIRLRPCRYG